MLTLKGRAAVVTGGARGLGRAIADMFAKNGMQTAILDIDADAARKAAEELVDAGCDAMGVQCDVSDLESIKKAVEAVADRFGRIDVLVNSAGILSTQSLKETTRDNWDRVLSVNLSGTFFMIQQTLPYLEKSPAARIINISSNAGRMGGFEGSLAYAASKGGIISITYGIARQLAPKNILVNCIAPGTTMTDIVKAYTPEAMDRLKARFPIGRLGQPHEIAAAACYLASEEASFTTGAVLDVNGGLFMG